MIIAQDGGAAGGYQLLLNIAPLLLIFGIFYWLLIRPQRKREMERQQMIESLKKNDHVITASGIFGTVVAVREKDILLRVDEANNVRIRVAKSAIAGLVKEGAEKEETRPAESG